MCVEGLSVKQRVPATQRLESWELDERYEDPVHVHPDTGDRTLLIAPVALDRVEGVQGVDSDSAWQARQFVKDLLAPGTADECVYAHRCALPRLATQALPKQCIILLRSAFAQTIHVTPGWHCRE